MKTSRMLNSIILGVVLSFIPMLTVAKEKFSSSDTFQAQGVLQEVITKGSGSVMIDNVLYKLASHVKIIEGKSSVKLRHLELGLDVVFTYKEGKSTDSKPVITSMSVIMK